MAAAKGGSGDDQRKQASGHPVLPGKPAIAPASWALSHCGSPATRTVLFRLASPATIERSRRGNSQARASRRNSASLARPSRAGAVTVAFRVYSPAAEAARPISRSVLAPGDRRTATRRPSRIRVTGPSGKVFEHQVAQEIQQQDQYHRRNVDPAEVGDHGSDRPEQRFGYPPQKVAGRGDHPVIAVDDAKGQEPTQHR